MTGKWQTGGVPVAEIPVSVTVSRKDGSARIQWAEGSDADLQRVVQLLIRAGEMVLAYEKRPGAAATATRPHGIITDLIITQRRIKDNGR